MRKLTDFITGFERYLKPTETPFLFKKWAAITCVAGALEQRCFIEERTGPGGRIYPTMAVVLVAPSGTGKSAPVRLCNSLWGSVKRFNVGPESLSAAGLYDEFIALKANQLQSTQPLLIAAEELGSFFFQGYDPEILSLMVKTLDVSETGISFRRRGEGRNHVPHPSLTILLASQPGRFARTFPYDAYDQGMMARFITVFADEKLRRPLRFQLEDADDLKESLQADLAAISIMKGRFSFTKQAWETLEGWYSSQDDAPNHPLLQTYNQRRPVHLMKLAMVLSASTDDSRRISQENVEDARELLLAVESKMHRVFEASGDETDSLVIDSIVEMLRMRTKRYIRENQLYSILCRKVSMQKIPHFIETLIYMGHLRIVGSNAVGSRQFEIIDPNDPPEDPKVVELEKRHG